MTDPSTTDPSMTDPPMTGAPMTGAPMTGAPMTGTPMTGTPMTGTPMIATPMTGAQRPVPPAPDAMIRRMRALRPRLTCTDDELLETYWRYHPRFRFVKTAAANAALLDIGAGSGGLAQWRRWLAPVRDDLVFHGVDRRRGEHAGLYRAWEEADLDHSLPAFPGVAFDAFVLSHVVEHLREPARLIGWMATRARPGARVYLEWPSEAAARQPTRAAFLARGIDIEITNFFDDATHLRVVAPEELTRALAAAGFALVESGTVGHGLVGEEMLARNLAGGDGFARLAGYWSLSGWSNWIVAAWPG